MEADKQREAGGEDDGQGEEAGAKRGHRARLADEVLRKD
jgi:hypothetical protein